MTIDPKLLDELPVDYKRPEDIITENGLLKQLTKALLDRALNAELTAHVGYDKHDPAGYNSGNSRNGATKKKLKGVWHPVFLDFARYWEFTPRLCRPYRAQTKGKLESGVKYVRYSVPQDMWVQEIAGEVDIRTGRERIAMHGKAQRKHSELTFRPHHQVIRLGVQRAKARSRFTCGRAHRRWRSARWQDMSAWPTEVSDEHPG